MVIRPETPDYFARDPSPLEEAVLELLEAEGISTEICDQICVLIDRGEQEYAFNVSGKWSRIDE